MNPDQLDLFAKAAQCIGGGGVEAARPKGAAIHCFPLNRNMGKVRHVAEAFAKRCTDGARVQYWNQVCNGLSKTLRKAGIPQEEIKHQLIAFREAVSAQLDLVGSVRPKGSR